VSTSWQRYGTDAVDQLVERIASLERSVEALRSRPFDIPLLNADPASDSGYTIWRFADGRVRHRIGGTVHTLVPVVDSETWPDIPTLSSDPAASTGIDIYIHGGSGELRSRAANGTWLRYAPITATTSSDSAPKASTSTSTSKTTKAADTSLETYTLPFDLTWGASWCDSHNAWEADGEAYYGNYPYSVHGQRRVMLGFNDTAIRNFIGSGQATQVELYLANVHTNPDQGTQLRIGGHSNSARPSGYSGIVARNVVSRHYGKREAKWVTISTVKSPWFAKRLKSGEVRGILIDQNSLSSALYGAINPGPTKLRLTVRK
jgi:hypothetical protein